MDKLSKLTELRANDNILQSLANIAKLHTLRRLDVHNNVLVDLGFQASTLRNLQYLDASHNKLAALEHFEACISLQHLRLHNNVIGSIQLRCALIPLIRLELSHNKLSKLDITHFPSLQYLDVSHNELSRLAGLDKLSNLKDIRIGFQEHSDWQAPFSANQPIERIHFDGFTSPSLTRLHSMENLSALSITHCHLNAVPKQLLLTLTHLTFLDVGSNTLRTLKPIRQLKALRELHAVDNEIELLENLLSCVLYLPELHVLDMRMNPLTAKFYPKAASDDAAHISGMNDATFVRRSCYRSVLLTFCRHLTSLDRLPVRREDRQASKIIFKKLRPTLAEMLSSTTKLGAALLGQTVDPKSTPALPVKEIVNSAQHSTPQNQDKPSTAPRRDSATTLTPKASSKHTMPNEERKSPGTPPQRDMGEKSIAKSFWIPCEPKAIKGTPTTQKAIPIPHNRLICDISDPTQHLSRDPLTRRKQVQQLYSPRRTVSDVEVPRKRFGSPAHKKQPLTKARSMRNTAGKIKPVSKPVEMALEEICDIVIKFAWAAPGDTLKRLDPCIGKPGSLSQRWASSTLKQSGSGIFAIPESDVEFHMLATLLQRSSDTYVSLLFLKNLM